MTSTAVLLDIDGTLVDSNFLHVEAWAQTFFDLGLTVPSWRIQRSIGADSAELLERHIGEQPEHVQTRAKNLHTKYYDSLVPRLTLLPGARELILELHGKGVRIVLATSAPADELEALLKLLDIEDETFAVTSTEDVERAKPEPDIISIALAKGGVDARRAIWSATPPGTSQRPAKLASGPSDFYPVER